MTWREFILTSCAWILALVMGGMGYVEIVRSKLQSQLNDQSSEGVALVLNSKVEPVHLSRVNLIRAMRS
jgi:hypothetical protein